MKGNKFFLYSLTSLAAIAANAAVAEELATAPSLEGGFSAMIGTMYMVPSVNNQAFGENLRLTGITPPSPPATQATLESETLNLKGDYDFGIQAAIGYVFDNTANGIELSYRNFDSSSDGQQAPFAQGILIPGLLIAGVAAPDGFDANQGNKFENFDLMISQFLDIGSQVQMRFLGGLSYLSQLDQTTTVNGELDAFLFTDGLDVFAASDVSAEANSSYDGWGPRVGMDARYDFGSGFGIVGGASAAYFIGNMDTNSNINTQTAAVIFAGGPPVFIDGPLGIHANDTNDNHAVTNLRANLGIDYVVYFEERDLPTLGLELGYEVDSYLDGVSQISALGSEVKTTDITFSGPYLNLKGVF